MKSSIVESLKGKRSVVLVEALDSRVPTYSVPCELGLLVYFTFPFCCLYPKSHPDLSTAICGVSRIGK